MEVKIKFYKPTKGGEFETRTWEELVVEIRGDSERVSPMIEAVKKAAKEMGLEE